MINTILQYPLLYRLYQKTVRSNYSEYDFLKYLFSKIKIQNLKVLDLCCGDSFILNYINNNITNYLGVDNSTKYLKYSKNKWPEFEFLKLDLNNESTIETVKEFQPNFIFINGALHHLDDKTVENINKLVAIFDKSYFLSIDPVRANNKFINSLMINFDRGKYIRKKSHYSELMQGCQNIIIDDFYKMSFKQIFHYKNLNLEKLYSDWKQTILSDEKNYLNNSTKL